MDRCIHYVYIMASRSRVIYIGSTTEFESRMKQHKEGRFDGFTKKYRCDRLVYFERFVDSGSAVRRERQLKGWKRERKVALVASQNPAWEDLAADWYQDVKVGKKQVLRPPRAAASE